MTTSEPGIHGARRKSDVRRQMGDSAMRGALGSGELHAQWRGVLIPGPRTADPYTVAAAACSFAGPVAVISGWTATWLHGCTAVDPLPVHLTVPYGHWLRARPGLVAHNGLHLSDDTVEIDGLPVLVLDRLLADLLCRDRPQDALAVLDQALAAVDPAGREAFRQRVGERIARRSDPRGRRRTARLLDLATGLAFSPAESRMLFRLVDLGFPVPQVNLPVHDATGAVLFLLDHAWPEYRIAVEYDGHEAHLGREDEDAARQAELERRGYIVVRVRAADMRDLSRVERELDAAFRARGLALNRKIGTLQPRRHRERP
ncbi:DUF559 domain-containing protein [Pseudonocardia kujensis]|uniref:DUF559 domain-containing protein n=1 Tax=Pseudonocardia kujensis TaxID=1128675 RepID=UPI001E566FFB|nr:DUF559 domain-containing protein [Pseudonocardia kujensis]MCE0766689.1 DUF559 domain-containing protein [Pseudonocardia kujensis]